MGTEPAAEVGFEVDALVPGALGPDAERVAVAGRVGDGREELGEARLVQPVERDGDRAGLDAGVGEDPERPARVFGLFVGMDERRQRLLEHLRRALPMAPRFSNVDDEGPDQGRTKPRNWQTAFVILAHRSEVLHRMMGITGSCETCIGIWAAVSTPGSELRGRPRLLGWSSAPSSASEPVQARKVFAHLDVDAGRLSPVRDTPLTRSLVRAREVRVATSAQSAVVVASAARREITYRQLVHATATLRRKRDASVAVVVRSGTAAHV